MADARAIELGSACFDVDDEDGGAASSARTGHGRLHGVTGQQPLQRLQYTFFPFYHPYTALFLPRAQSHRASTACSTAGSSASRRRTTPATTSFADPTARPPAAVPTRTPADVVDFERGGAYSIYNWELFFHAPLLVATG